MKKLYKIFPILLCFSIFGLICPSSSKTQDTGYMPYISAATEYNDNILFENDEKLNDFIFTLKPGIWLKYDTERLNLNTFAEVSLRRYANETLWDRNDQFYNLYINYRFTERLSLRSKAFYRKDVTLESRVIGVEETTIDDEEIVELGIERFSSGRRLHNEFVSLDYRMTELTTLKLKYRYSNTTYDFEGNSDYDVNEFGVSVLKELEGQRDKVGTEIAHKKNNSETRQSDSLLLSLIWDHFFSKTTSLYAKIGLRYTQTDFNYTIDDDESWNGIADLRLRRLGENYDMRVGFKQSLQTTSDGSSANVSKLYWDSELNLSERLSFEIEGSLYVVRDDGENRLEEDSVSFYLNPSFKYLLTENHSIALEYSYTIDYDRVNESNPDTQRNRVWVVFEFAFPDKF